MAKQHQNSKIVTLFRAGSFLARSQGPDIQEYFADAKTPIGSYFQNRTSNRIGSGLDFWEEELLLPYLIDVDKGDREFRKKVNEFYENISTPVAYQIGTRLEIGLEKSNSEKLSTSNKPINISDYVRYRHALGHPFVAPSKADSDSSAVYQFYILDVAELEAQKEDETKEKDTALQIYLEIKKDPSKVDMLLTLLGTDIREYSGKGKEQKRVEKLRELAETSPSTFTKAYSAKNFETLYLIKAMTNTGVLKQRGVKYHDASSDKIIGNNLDEAVLWFLDSENSDIVSAMKGIMQEALLNPAPASVRKTAPINR